MKIVLLHCHNVMFFQNIIAIGFGDGSVTLLRGDITRQRSSKMKTLSDTGNVAISALAFK